ncbi:VOC family protein [Glaciimonas sp. PCH181]|uniref:VOC family protein n=1 Tax=Glaciimonas sp. PCH181 TaxID=2133943 RepID=UPI000D3383E5|nr:VOC family protein [Glaciimonas sp. PCH181]PUA16750.1 diguanylate cyclase [Glaciimonas sp. PCH181]
MPVTALNHYNLRAPHALMRHLRDFYCDVVGLEQGERPAFTSVGYWLYAGGQPILHLSEALAGDVRNNAPTTFDHVAFTCIDQEEMAARLAAHQVQYRVVQVPLTGQTQFFFRDPAGNGIELNFAA